MNTKQAAEIRKGILAARDLPARPGVTTILNSRHYSKQAFKAFNLYRRKHVRGNADD